MKRRIVKLAVFLLLGAIVNVAVAWGSAWLISTGVGNPFQWHVSRSGQPWVISLHHAFSASRAFTSRGNQIWDANKDVDSPVPAWTGWPDDLDDLSPQRDNMVDVRGWPMLAMRSRWVSPVWVSGITLPQHRPDPPGFVLLNERRALPLELLWPGFAVNTLFYAGVLWLLLLAPFALRRRHRIKRGLCPKCAYDLRGCASQQCPECGQPVAKHKAQTQKAEMP